jgi:hypothetical protein
MVTLKTFKTPTGGLYAWFLLPPGGIFLRVSKVPHLGVFGIQVHSGVEANLPGIDSVRRISLDPARQHS